MTFDNLTDVEFEELCYDFLYELGMQDVSWRKGTGKSSSPADNGRDIECDYCRYDSMFQRIEKEHWFVECKRGRSGICRIHWKNYPWYCVDGSCVCICWIFGN